MTAPHKITHMLASGWATFLIALALASPLLIWTFDRGSPVMVHRLDLFPSEVYPGQKVLRRIEVTRYRRCVTDVSIVIIDGDRVRWVIDEPPIDTPGPLGARDSYSQPMIVPKDAAPGQAEMRVTTKRVCNPLHHLWPLMAYSDPIRFTILEPPH